MAFNRFIVLIYLVFRYRLFFLIGCLPFCGWFKLGLNLNSKKQAQRICKALESFGPSFVKLGQILSLRIDLVGETFAEVFSSLREDGKKYSLKSLKPAMLKALDTPFANEFFNKYQLSWESLLKNNQLQLVAVGSVAQVYKLQLAPTKSLAIKVIKPDVRKALAKDIAFLHKVFSLAESKIKEAKRVKVLKVLKRLKYISEFETNLRMEAAATMQAADDLANYKDFCVPKVYWGLTTKDVLVTSWVEGVKVNQVVKQPGLDGNLLAKKLLNLFFIQTLKCGFFHGDLHSANIIVTPKGKIALVDFGITGSLTDLQRERLLKIWQAFLNQDYKSAAKMHFKAGWVDSSYNSKDLEIAIRSFVEPLFVNEGSYTPTGSLLVQLFDVTRAFGMEIQDTLLLIQKNMLLLEAIVKILTPQNIWIISREIINQDDFKESNLQKISYLPSQLQAGLSSGINVMQNAVTNGVVTALNRVQHAKYNHKFRKIWSFVAILLIGGMFYYYFS